MPRFLTAMLLFIVLLLPVAIGAQIGRMSFLVVDPVGTRVRDAHVIVNGFDMGFTDRNGLLTVKMLPAGRHDIIVAKEAYDEFRIREFPLRCDADTTITITIQRSRIELDSAGDVVSLPSERYSEYPEKPNLYRGQPIFHKQYIDCLPRVRAIGMEFGGCYEASHRNDTTFVSVIASVENVSAAPVSTCGAFSFIAEYKTLNIPLGAAVELPRLPTFRQTIEGPTLRCEIPRLDPGDSARDTLCFQYKFSEFETFFGEAILWILFFHGDNGVEWQDSKHIDLGTLLIPIGHPSN